jgi:hypothetical protein
MRRLTGGIVAAIAAAVLAAGPACKWKSADQVAVDDEGQPALSVVNVAQPRTDRQLLSGFHGVEGGGAWRWTMGKFAVALEPPPGAARNGATLELKFTLPESVIERRKTVTLSAWVERAPLGPETYTKAGKYTYARDVPARACVLSPVKAGFALDHFLGAGEVDSRELGLIVSSVGLTAK